MKLPKDGIICVLGDQEYYENRIIIADGHDFGDYKLPCTEIDKILSDGDGSLTIISGGAVDADVIGEKYAKERNLNFVIIEANWNKY